MGVDTGLLPYADLFAMTPAPLLVLTPALVIREANHAYMAAVGRRQDELIGRYMFDVFPMPDDPEGYGMVKVRASMLRACDTGRTDTMALQRYDIPAPAGGFEQRYWSPIHVPILDETGRVVLLMHRAVDVTDLVLERRRSREQRAQDDEPDLYARAHELATAVKAQQVASRRLSSLANLALRLGSAESVQDLANIIFGVGLPALQAVGGSIAVRSPDSDTLHVTLTPSLGEALQRAYTEVPLHGPLPTSIAARNGEIVLVPDERAAAGYEGMPAALVMSATRAWAVLPLQVADLLLGSIAIGFADPQDFGAEDVELLRAFASQCAQVLDRLQVRDAERKAGLEVARLAETLQRSLLSEPAPSEGLLFAVEYQPAQEVAQVGGDWYDAFQIDSGATIIVIGDVAGHDQDAAATMAQVRNLVRGIAQTLNQAPASVLAALDHALDKLNVSVLATIVLAEISPPIPGHSNRTLRWCNAGHPPPLLLRSDGTAELLSRPPDLLVGLTGHHQRADHQVTVAAGDIALLYTDGLVETRRGDIDDDIEQLRRRVSGHDPDAGPQALLQMLIDHTPTHDDDIALLAVRVL
jgi:serine phosphatase RsbU (regulator of sigma subunit)